MRPQTLTLVLLAVAVAGCLGTSPDPGSPAALPGAAPDADEIASYARDRLIQDHEHNGLPDAHAGTIGVDPVSFAPMRESYPDGETYFEMAVKGDWAYVVFGPEGGFVNPGDEAGFMIFDVSAPSDPEKVGTWLGQPLGDIEVTDDNAYVFASTQRNGYPYPWTINPDAGPKGHAPRGTFIVDVQDKSAPETVGFAPLPTNGPHTITYVEHPDGRELLLQSTYDILFTAYPEDVGQNVASQRVHISQFDRELETLVPLSTFQKVVDDVAQATKFPHDATAHVDPDTGDLIMDVAYWSLGLVTVDITDPSQPEELARFADTGPSAYTNTHLVRVFPGTIDGKTVGILEPEIPTGEDPGQFTFVDLSDPSEPVRLGYWRVPQDLIIDKPFIFSPHNFDPTCGGDGQPLASPDDYGEPCEDPTVALSHFHAGLWTLDASDPTDPTATGFFFPNVTRDVPSGFPFTGFATAFVQDDRIYAPEVWTGMHVLEVPS